MKNSKLRRVLLLLACAVMLVSLSVGATLAYLTSTTEVVQNTFTVGNIKITLDEAAIKEYNSLTNSYDKADPEVRVQANTYKVRPGVKMWKDPTIHVLNDSDHCYIRAFVTISYNVAADAVVDESWVQEMNPAFTWSAPETTYSEDNTVVTRVYEVRYNDIFTAGVGDLPLFKGINVPTTLDNAEIAALANFKIDIIANAIQSDGFANADAAWAAFDAQMAAQ